MERARVVIADDESIVRTDLKEMLTSLDYLVVGEVGDGRSAVNTARELKPDVVLMDIKMPDMDGIEAAKILTEEQIAPVVLLTAYSQKELVDRAKDAGVVGYLIKPFRESDLMPAIEVAISRFKEFQTVRQEVEDLQNALETRKLVERAKEVLMRRRNMTGEQAYRWMQRRSMDNRKSMRHMAEAVLLSDEI